MLEAAKRESGLCNELHLYFFIIFFFPPQEGFGKEMSEKLERPGSFYAYHSFAFMGAGGLEPHAEAFRPPQHLLHALGPCPSSKQG